MIKYLLLLVLLGAGGYYFWNENYNGIKLEEIEPLQQLMLKERKEKIALKMQDSPYFAQKAENQKLCDQCRKRLEESKKIMLDLQNKEKEINKKIAADMKHDVNRNKMALAMNKCNQLNRQITSIKGKIKDAHHDLASEKEQKTYVSQVYHHSGQDWEDYQRSLRNIHQREIAIEKALRQWEKQLKGLEHEYAAALKSVENLKVTGWEYRNTLLSQQTQLKEQRENQSMKVAELERDLQQYIADGENLEKKFFASNQIFTLEKRADFTQKLGLVQAHIFCESLNCSQRMMRKILGSFKKHDIDSMETFTVIMSVEFPELQWHVTRRLDISEIAQKYNLKWKGDMLVYDNQKQVERAYLLISSKYR